MKLINDQMSFKLINLNDQEKLLLDLYNTINNKLVNHKWRKNPKDPWNFVIDTRSILIRIKLTPFNSEKRRKVLLI